MRMVVGVRIPVWATTLAEYPCLDSPPHPPPTASGGLQRDLPSPSRHRPASGPSAMLPGLVHRRRLPVLQQVQVRDGRAAGGTALSAKCHGRGVLRKGRSYPRVCWLRDWQLVTSEGTATSHNSCAHPDSKTIKLRCLQRNRISS